MTLHGPVLEACRRTPDAIALQPGQTGAPGLTFAELADRSARWASALRAAGAGRGSVVAVCLPRGIDQIVGLLAVLRAGAAFVATEPDHPVDRLRGILTDAAVEVVLAAEPDAQRLRDHGALPPTTRVLAPAVVTGSRFVGLQDPQTGGFVGLEDIRTPPGDLPEVAPEDPAYVIFTSGSTGRPKGSVISHGSVSSTIRWLCEDWPLNGSDRVLQKISISFDVSIAEIFHPLSCGARLVLAEPGGHRDSGYLAWAAAEFAITVMVFVPSALDVFLLEPAARSLPALRLTMVAGEALIPALVNRYRALYDAELVNLYGPSECSIYATGWTCPAQPPYRPVTIGRPGPEVIALVVDEHGSAADTGELYLGGPCVGEGYLGRPELNERVFVADPTGRHPERLYRTGDLVRRLANGELEFLGRIDHQLKIRGFRVELGEITSALLETFDLARAAVLPAPGLGGGVELHAFVVPRPGHAAPSDPSGALVDRLPDYMIPVRWTTVDELPVTPNGKLDAAALLAMERPADSEAVAGDRIAELWRRATGLPIDDPAANLFALGGNSITAARLLALARAELGVDLRYDEFAAEPTLAALGRAGATGARDELVRRSDDRVAPLHPAQRRLWLLEQLLPGSPAYNIVSLHRIQGPLDTGALAAAVRAVIARHEPLRTTFHNGLQEISPEPTTGLVVRPAVESIVDWADAVARTRFDIATGPLLRVELAAGEPGEHWLVWCLHHLIADGWSLEVLWDDLSTAYQGLSSEAPPRYGDVAVWAAGRSSADDLAYWREHLDGAPAGTALPWRAPGFGPRSRERADRRCVELGAGLTEALARTASAERVTPASVVLTTFAVVLARWSGQDDLVVGTPLAGRHHPALDGVVGFFNSTVVLRAKLAGCPTGRAALHRLAGELITAQAHDTAPFDEVVTALGRACQPLFDVWFNVFNYAERPLRLPGLRIEAAPAPLPGALFDLGLYVHTDALELVYDTERLDATYARALLDEVHAVLADLVADPDRPLGTLGTPEPAWAPLPDRPARQGLVEVIDRHEHRHGELIARSRTLADRLRAAGAAPGTVVALVAAAGPDLPAAVLAVRRTGAAFAILDPAHPEAWRAAQLDSIGPVAVVDIGARCDIAAQEGKQRHVALPPDTAYVMFTSGSTAAPRAVLGAEEPVTVFLRRYTERFGLSARDVFCLLSGYGHDPVLRDLLTPLWTGARLEIPAPEVRADPLRLLEWLAGTGVTVLHLTPLLADLLLGAAGGSTLPAVRLTCFGGDALPTATVRAWRALAPHSRLVNFYGCTETPQAGTWHEITDVPNEPIMPVGATGPSGHLVMRRPDGTIATVGQVGEICWRGALPTLGYLDDPDATAHRYLADPTGVPLVRTGDRGRLRADGLVQVLGRGDDEVKIRGHRVDPGQLEAVLTAHDGVRAAAVLTISGRLAACVVPDGSLTAAAVRDHLSTRVPAALVPEQVLLLDELPLTPNGKLDRDKLRERLLTVPAGSAALSAGGTRATVRDIWQAVLGKGELDDHANFFELGATSLALLRAHALLAGALGVGVEVLPVLTLFEHSTVASLATYVDALLGGTHRAGVAVTAQRRSTRHDQERAIRRGVHGVGVRT